MSGSNIGNGSSKSKPAPVLSIITDGNANTGTATTTTNYQRMGAGNPVMMMMLMNPHTINQNVSYDSEDSYRSQRSYTSYNYLSTSIRDRIYYSNNAQQQQQQQQQQLNDNYNNGRSITIKTPAAANNEQPPSSSQHHQQQKQQQQQQPLLTEEDQQRIQYLALRKFHIPGHTFTQDYIYWFCNNHPFICFCYADSRHPLGTIERIINLVSSLAFGLAATCCVFLWFYYHENDVNNNNNTDYDNNVYDDLTMDASTDNKSEEDDSLMQFDHVVFTIPYIDVHVTTGIVTLLIFSGPLHVIFDLGIYFLQACPPCRVNGCCYYNVNNNDHPYNNNNNYNRSSGTTTSSCAYTCLRLLYRQECWLWVGTYVAFCISVAAVSLAIQVTLLRASIIEEQDNNESNISYQLKDYHFILYYLLEIFVANFIAFPIGTFTMFSGVLGCCGRIPGLGGRPYQVRKHQRRHHQQQKQQVLLERQQQQQQPVWELQSIDATTIKRSNLA